MTRPRPPSTPHAGPVTVDRSRHLFSALPKSPFLRDDPQKAVAQCRQALALAPHHQNALANMGVGLRLMGDEGEELLNGYDTLVRRVPIYGCAAEGFSSMEHFNTVPDFCA